MSGYGSTRLRVEKVHGITVSELNAETSVNTEPHCDSQWFLPADKVLHYIHLSCSEDTLAPQRRTELLEGIHVLLQCGGECY